MEPRTSQLTGQQNHGFALVVVLSLLVLMAALVIAFFSTVSTDLSSSQSNADGQSARRLADSTVQIVTARIMEGARSRDRNGSPQAWISQPGMIRTFRGNGTPGEIYRLYSASSAVIPGASFTPAAEMPPADWDSQSNVGVFTDLNAPVLRDGDVVFPIVDPRAKAASPSASVEGFDYTADINGVVIPSGSPDAQRLPMPVRWLYQLQDGTLVAPISGGSSGVRFGAGPTEANPIVGRIAFWTDDETSKVNVNTASEGVYYDIPRFYSRDEYRLADSPPVIGEFQRYPGHPATTSLSVVLAPWLPVNHLAVSVSDYDPIAKYYQLSPRVDDGTLGGTKSLTSTSAGSRGGTIATASGLPAMTLKADRLYSSVEEMFFNPLRGVNQPILDQNAINRTAFFLTTNSRAPDTTLFGTPRIGIWPIFDTTGLSTSAANNYLTQQDRLIAFAGTINSHKYFFQRRDPTSSTVDYAGIPRNQQLISYLKNLTGRAIPGFGASFQSKFGAPETDQIITSIFDYIRASNLNDPNLGVDFTYTPSIAKYGYFAAGNNRLAPGQVVPIKIGNTRGAGRFPVIDQAAMVFFLTGDPKRLEGGRIEAQVSAYLLLGLHHPMLGAMNCVDYFQVRGEVTSGDFGMTPTGKTAGVTVSGGGSFTMLGGTPKALWANRPARYALGGNGRMWGGNHETAPFTQGKKLSDPNPQMIYTFVASTPITVVINDPDLPAAKSGYEEKKNLYNSLGRVKWDMKGGTFDIRFLTPTSPLSPGANYDELQHYTLEFPDVAGLNFPRGQDVNSGGTTDVIYRSLNTRFASGGGIMFGGDIVRAIQLDHTSGSKGDIRNLAYTSVVPASWYSPHQKYKDATNDFAHTFRMGHGWEWWGAMAAGKPGVLVPGLTNSFDSKDPFLRPEINGVFRADGGPGDWDTGFGDRPDGAYLNRADEGIRPAPTAGGKAYFNWDAEPSDKNLTSPNRQMPSAAMFGSLPSGVVSGKPWQTLLFRPSFDGHPGAASPPDYMLLDLFTMPIVEPYPISEPLSTAGRVNLNYQIMPFSYIRRATGLYAVMKAERVTAIPDAFRRFKEWQPDGSLATATYRHPINMQETLTAFDQRFAAGEVFRSAAEICGVPLVPDAPGASATGMAGFWNAHRRTGDNLRERPYATIYPRVTTQSNTYTVYFRVQSLKKVNGTNESVWVEGKDRVVGEFRGSAVIERYVDPADPNIPDFAVNPTDDLDRFYRFRVVNFKRFSL